MPLLCSTKLAESAALKAHATTWNMRTPVFEEQRPSNFSTPPEYNAALPLMPPTRLAHTQGLQLATNGDVLIGRADNGMMLLCVSFYEW